MTTTENFDYSFLLDLVSQSNNEFKKENQVENNISTTTKQTLKHCIYSNVEVTISVNYNDETDTSVWVFDGEKMSRKFNNISLEKAIIEANKLINN